MNERIQELAQQAGFKSVGKLFGQAVPEYAVPLEKFAELIVRECLCKIENEAAQYHEPVWAIELTNDIKDHFGVRE